MGKGRLFHSQKNLPDMDRRCDQPWRDLFLWAILQNRQEMANYFWAMVSQLTNMSDELIFINKSIYMFTIHSLDLNIS